MAPFPSPLAIAIPWVSFQKGMKSAFQLKYNHVARGIRKLMFLYGKIQINMRPLVKFVRRLRQMKPFSYNSLEPIIFIQKYSYYLVLLYSDIFSPSINLYMFISLSMQINIYKRWYKWSACSRSIGNGIGLLANALQCSEITFQ